MSLQNLKGQIFELRTRLSSVQNQLEQTRNMLIEQEEKEQELQKTIAAQRQAFKEKLESQVSAEYFIVNFETWNEIHQVILSNL